MRIEGAEIAVVSIVGGEMADSGADRCRVVPTQVRIAKREIEAHEIIGALAREGPAAPDVRVLHDTVRAIVSEGGCVVVRHDPTRPGPGHHHHSLDCVGDCATVPLPLLEAAAASDAWLMGPKTSVRELCSVSGVPTARIAESNPVIDDYGRFSHLWNGPVRMSRVERPRSLGAAVARAFGEMHGMGVVHGDVHGHNIFVQDDGTVKFYGDSADAKFVCPSAPPALFATDLVHVMESMIPEVWQGFRDQYAQGWPGGSRVVEFIERSGHPTWQAAFEAGNYLDALKRIDEVLAARIGNGLDRIELLTNKSACLARLGHPRTAAEAHKEALRLAIKENVPDRAVDHLRYSLAVLLSLAGDDAAALSTLAALVAKAERGSLDPELRPMVEDSIKTINRRRR